MGQIDVKQLSAIVGVVVGFAAILTPLANMQADIRVINTNLEEQSEDIEKIEVILERFKAR